MRRCTRSRMFIVLSAILIISLVGCGSTSTSTPLPASPSATAASAAVTGAAPTSTQIPPSPTPVPPTATPETPTVGGTLVWAMKVEPMTLDVHQSVSIAGPPMYFGASLLEQDPETGEYMPYLAESWTISDDGLNLDFQLRKGVKFHDGAPLTAQDYAWTFDRVRDPSTRAPAVGTIFAVVQSAQALDDYTLRLVLKTPSFPFLLNLADAGYAQPMSKAALEAPGADPARHPVGVGPYKVLEWETGERIILERNPDYDWGPTYAHSGPYYIQTIEFRFVNEDATILAGLEAGEIDYMYESVRPEDLTRIAAAQGLVIHEGLQLGVNEHVLFDVNKAPFDDVRVRQALNYAIDREALVAAGVAGQGVPQYGPLSMSVPGYSPVPDQEKKYAYDLAKAKALMADAGWVEGPDGILQKDGKPFEMKLISFTDIRQRVVEIVQEQYKRLGLKLTIDYGEVGVQAFKFMGDEFQIGVGNWTWSEFDIMRIVYHSSQLGALNWGRINDPEVDRLLNLSQTTMDPKKRQQACDELQAYFVDQAYIVPLYTPYVLQTLSARIKGARFRKVGSVFTGLILNDAYISN